jgi:ribosomal protein S18 acetylase RimI-like enzyme
MIRKFEELSNNAWPALQTMHYDGWTLRFANGVTKRSNSVNMLYPSTLNPDEKIDFCEQLYESQNITPCFKITGIADPADIDQRLAHRGYYIHSAISFQTRDISGITSVPQGDIDLATDLNPSWIDDFIRMNEFDPSRKNTYTGIMQQLLLPKCLVTLSRNHQTIGVGLGVLEGKHIGLFDLVVDKNHRNAGLGRLIVENILHWGKKQGASTAYLQVLTNNTPALSLYKKLEFTEIYQYWYRMKPSI